MQRLYTICPSILLLLCHRDIWAAENDVLKNTPATSSPITTSVMFDTMIGLGLVLILIFLLAWLIRRTGHFGASNNGQIKMLAGLSLGPRERAVLLDVDGERILIGVTTHHIQTLHILNKHSPEENKEQFSDLLQQVQS